MAFPQMAPITPIKRERPLVFISASRVDSAWRDYLKTKLDEYADQIQWWDNSKIKTSQYWSSETEAAIQRASLAVVFLSRAYLGSNRAAAEFRRLGEHAESKKLGLFPILLEECDWQQYAFLRDVHIWNDAKPIGDVTPKGARTEMGAVARSIVNLINASQSQSDPEFDFSEEAQRVLREAADLAVRSGRDRLSSSCLLFALAEATEYHVTRRFVRNLLDVHNGYEKEFHDFLTDGKSAGGEPVRLSGITWGLSRNLAAALTHASRIADVVNPDSKRIHTRHLFAALITPWRDGSQSLLNRVKRLGLNLPSLRSALREHVAYIAASENPLGWDAVLAAPLAVTPSDESTPQDIELAPTTPGVPSYKTTYSAFIPDRTSYGPRDTDAPLADSLGVRTYASHLAQLIAAKETFMPLSIGLFGAWGAGKSHFMDLMDEQLRQITRHPASCFHKQIVQIHFNAWHYLDTNLWANLVSEIFDQLFDKLESRGDKEAKQVENLKNKLADQSALAAEAKAALDRAENVRKEAEKQLRSAMQERAKQENTVSTLLDDLKNLIVDEDLKKQLRDVANGLGLPKVQTSFRELEARAEEVRSLGGRTRALVLAVFTGPGWWYRTILLIVALAAPLAISWLAVHGALWIQELLAGAGRTIAQAVTAIAALSTWLATQARAGNTLVSKLENAYDKVTKVRAEREAKDDAARAQATLAEKIQAEEQARHTLHEAEEKLKNIKAELAEMAPGRQLIRFLRERATTEDYRRHLGLVSLVRKDFEQLSELLTAVSTEDGELPKIDRIVLYIDDLDRCRAERVIEVLEAVHLLLAFPLFAVVVAVDPRWLRQSLLDHYPRLLGGVDDDKTKAPTRSIGRPATPQDYLEKIFQVPFNLQPMEKTGFEALVKHLFTHEGSELKTPQTIFDAEAMEDLESIGVTKDKARELDERLQGTFEIIKETRSLDQPSPAPSAEPKQTPPDPERLVLTQNEVNDVQRFQLLFQTPRAVKRLANTYSLIRVGLDESDWNNYLGLENASGSYRVPLLLLAVTSAFPALARPWLLWLRETPPTNWKLDEDAVTKLLTKHSDTTDRADWEKLQHCLNRLDLDGWPPPDHEVLAKWLPRVARYSF